MAARRAKPASNIELKVNKKEEKKEVPKVEPYVVQAQESDEQKKRSLPPQFAETILDLEILMDCDIVEIMKVRQLLELYMLGVEYYESIGDQKFIYFNKKMSSLMMKPNVIDAMSRDSPVKNQDQTPIARKQSIREAEVRQKEEQIRKTVVYSHQDNDEKAKALVKTVAQEIKQNTRVINDSLDSQKRALYERLNARRSKTLTKASSVPVIIESANNSDNEENQSPSNVATTTPQKVDFSLIANAIHEDDREDDDEQNKKKKTVPKETINKFKEQILSVTPFDAEESQPKHKSRSNSQASSMREKGGSISSRRLTRDRKVSQNSTIKQKRKVKSRSEERQQQNVHISREQLLGIKVTLESLQMQLISKQTTSLESEAVLEAKREEEEDNSISTAVQAETENSNTSTSSNGQQISE